MSTVDVSPQVKLTQAVDELMCASRAMGGFMELILSLPDDRKITITRGKLYSLLQPVENGLIEAHQKVRSARQEMAGK